MNEPLHERMRMTIAPNSPWRLTRGIVANWSEEVSILLSELAQAKADVGALRSAVVFTVQELEHMGYRRDDPVSNDPGAGREVKWLRRFSAALPEHLRGASE